MWFSSALMLGSSPLARGLPLRITTIRPPTRIIPARAGFTVTVPPTSAQPWDHPRSRGVYPTSAAPSPTKSGSSPLARGLREGRCRWSCSWGDHPRSRGVYLVQTVSLTVDRWIIPARAGFTPRGRVRGRGRPDHPRSRGVYPSGSYASMMRDGSSPLARGLPPTGPPGRAGRGIIPARAGFTECPAPPDLAARDHPRSRGVYTVTSSRAPRAPGSSPLARGLHGRLGRTGRGPGIIPARAGFTGLADFEVTVAGDHPRSRGVYRNVASSGFTLGGSSPLARGLLPVGRREPSGGRIIPARAGFTRGRAPSRQRRADHPRSRGVYRHPESAFPRPRRIIPARAGFTP